MESYSSSASSTTTYLSQTMQPTKGSYSNSNSMVKQQPLPYHNSSLHSVRRSSAKPWKKPTMAPLAPTPPKIYKVDPINFRDLVQSLTSAPEYLEPRTLQSVAPPPIDIQSQNHFSVSPSPGSGLNAQFSVMYKDLSETLELSSMPHQQTAVHDSTVDSSYLKLGLQSPSSHHWLSFPLLSPGTMNSFEQGAVL